MPWLNNNTREIKRKCRQAKRDGKRPSGAVMSHSLRTITSNHHNCRILFKTNESVINPPQQTEATPMICESRYEPFALLNINLWPFHSALKKDTMGKALIESFRFNACQISQGGF